MTTISIRVKGLKETIDAIDQYSKGVQKGVSNAIEDGVLEIEREAAIRAPWDTGALSISIHSQMTGEYSGIVFDGVPYGVFQEFGTSKMAAHPFMFPAMELVRPKVEQKIADLTEGK